MNKIVVISLLSVGMGIGAGLADVPGDIFVETLVPGDWDFDQENTRWRGQTNIRIRNKYFSSYRIGSLSISPDNKGILAMVVRTDLQ